jgi:tetratricopeptide (TPR) repeat protein
VTTRQGVDLGQAIYDAGPLCQNCFLDVISEYPGAFVHAQPGGMSTQTVVVVDTSEMPNAFSSTTLYWPAECLNLAKAKECFERALAIDPKYAPAYSGLALYYYTLASLGQGGPLH